MSAIVSRCYETCHSVIFFSPSEVRDEVVWEAEDEDLLFASSYHTHIYMLVIYMLLNSPAMLKVRLTAYILLICIT